MALDYGVISRCGGWYQMVDPETGAVDDKEFREKETHAPEFWKDLLTDSKFNDFLKKKYRVGN